jgi:uncharacterized protein (DUF305 family)
MIPHHSCAILMCEGPSLQDQRIKDLCKEIVASQRREIDQMRALLEECIRTVATGTWVDSTAGRRASL